MATTIQDLEERVDALYNSILQMQLNLNLVIDKSDSAYNKCPQVDINTEDIETTAANLDYVAMMAEIDIPTEDE